MYLVHPDVSNLNYWEIPRTNLKLGKRLGRGQFGEVRLGEVRKRGVAKAVAVKTLRDSASDSDKRDLLGELDILVTVGQHENIISLVGACTKDDPLSIVVEYAPNGCLKDWLVTNSNELNTDSDYQNQPVPLSLLPMEQLIKFGIDVASGMSHLAAMQCVHRDLAARNVLLGENLEAKVSDFGLSRDIYESSEYVKSTKSKLPLRWMAYESLFYNVYTSQSDVWSFGVLLWEIITLGKQPYEGMNGKRMMDMIKDGGRLKKPTPCPDNIYTVMTTCWKTLPEDRPSFPQLKSSLHRTLQDFQVPHFENHFFENDITIDTNYTDLFEYNPNKSMSGHDDELIPGITAEQCAQRCLEGTTAVPEGECLSFDYRKVSGGRCQLSRDNKGTAGLTLDSNSQFDHYEMKGDMSSTESQFTT
ncbi:fibroblast growth factor receptor 2-like [Branchiostoma floridae x Branchiostoma belcheri]